MLNRLSFKAKIGLLVAAAILAVLVMAVTAALQSRSQITEARQQQLVTAVQAAHGVVMGFHAKAAKGEMSEADAKQAAADAVGMSRYGGPEGKTEYFYMSGTART